MKKISILIFSISAYFQVYGFNDSLYISSDRVNEIREMINITEGHFSEAYRSLQYRVNAGDLSVYGSGINRYNRSYLAQEASFLSLIAENEEDRIKYAQLAFQTIKDIYENTDQERIPHEGYGLSRAMMQLALALPWSWSREYWNEEEQEYVLEKINEALDAWLSYDHANFWKTRGSNWVAVCRGGELVLLLSSNQKNKRIDRYHFLIEQLKMHIQNGYGSLGVSQEGIGYTEYGGQFLLKAVYAAASMGDSTLYKEAEKKAWWKQAMYIESFQERTRKFLMTGVAGGGGFCEGWASLLLNLVPEEKSPYFLWWYDRHMGIKSQFPPNERYDFQRAGTIWALVYYPSAIEARDPTGIFPAGVADDHGYYFFRNRWKDENDIQFSIMADEYHHSHAWDQPEVFALNLLAHDARYIGGPGKERENQNYSSLLVNKGFNIKGSVRLTGKTNFWHSGQDYSCVSINGGLLYDSLGLEYAERKLYLRFLSNNEALILLTDSLVGKKANDYTWQLNLGQDLKLKTKQNHFKLLSKNGKVDGWVLNPEKFKFSAAENPFQINVNAKDTKIRVLLFINNREINGEYLKWNPGSNEISLGEKVFDLSSFCHKK